MWSRQLRWRAGPTATMPTTARPLINRLPPEVLGHCFDFLELSDRIRAATVCGYWRSVALGHAQLWCDLENVKMAALPDLLARTKRAGVRLVAHLVGKYPIKLLCDALNPHMGHMRHLDIWLWLQPYAARGCFHQLEYLLCSPAPLLETLSLVIQGAHMTLGTMLLGGVAPNLRSLRMHGWHFQGPSSSATRNVTTLHTHSFSAAHVSSWSCTFSALRELHLYDVSLANIEWLAWPGNPFPAHLRTLVLEVADYASHDVVDGAFEILQQANFTGLDELTLVDASAPLLDLVMQALGPIVSLELLDCGPHVRLVTASGRAVNFMRACVDGLEDVLLRHSGLFASLRELHVDRNVLGYFETCSVAHIGRTAPQIKRLVLTLGASDAGNQLGARQSLQLPALQELRLQGTPCVRLRADMLADVVCALHAKVPRLTLAGVEIVGERERLDGVLRMHFSEICEIPYSATGRTQRAEMFIDLTDSDSDSDDDSD